MKKRLVTIKTIGLVSIFLLFFMPTAYAYTKTKIHVGLSSEQNKHEISLSGSYLEIFEGDSIYPLFAEANNILVKADRYAYLIQSSYASYYDALYNVSENEVILYLGDAKWAVGKSFEQDAFAYQEREVYPNSYVLSSQEKGISIFINGHTGFVYKGITDMQVANGGLPVTVGNKTYRNRIEIKSMNQVVSAISIVDLEEYLYSVVPSEMPASWHLEALKAQACAARTYAVRQLGAHKNDGYDLCDTVHCQVYSGTTTEHENSTRAVDATKGEIIYHNGVPIDAVFSSSSGGVTDDSENVWSETVPYLRSVVDPFDTTGKKWSRQTTMTEINNSLAHHGYQIGQLTKLEIVKSPNGRVKELICYGTQNSVIIEKEKIRTVFNQLEGGSLESKYFTFGHMDTTDLPVEASENKADLYVLSVHAKTNKKATGLYAKSEHDTKTLTGEIYVTNGVQTKKIDDSHITEIRSSLVWTDETVIISGKGWGHGVGLSQHGAKGMAEENYAYDEIIKHYYQGVTIL